MNLVVERYGEFGIDLETLIRPAVFVHILPSSADYFRVRWNTLAFNESSFNRRDPQLFICNGTDFSRLEYQQPIREEVQRLFSKRQSRDLDVRSDAPVRPRRGPSALARL